MRLLTLVLLFGCSSSQTSSESPEELDDLDIENKELAVSSDAVLTPTKGAGLRVAGRKLHLSKRETLISIDARQADIRALFQEVATRAGVNIVLADSVKGAVSLRLVKVPWQDALRSIAATKGYGIDVTDAAWTVK